MPPSRERLRQLVLALQHPGGHEPARRIFASLSELGELPQIKELERQSAISGRSGERRHALNPEHVLQEASASHESGTINGSALLTVLVEQSDESSLGVGQRWYLLARQQSRISVSQLPRTRVRDLAQDAFLFEMQGMQVLLQPGEPQPDALAAWVLTLPATEKDTLLTMLASGQGTQAQALLLRRFRDTAATADHSASARRAAELLEAACARMLERKRAEEERRREQQRHRAAAQAAAHAKRLDDLAAEGDAPWKRVDEMIAAKKTSEYDLAVSLLRDLR